MVRKINNRGDTARVGMVIAVIVACLLLWGFVGGLQADKAGITCDVGLGEVLCWTWHQNLLGDIGEVFDDNSG